MSAKPLKVGATPGKLALIGVLAIAMAVVTASNWPSASAPPAEPSPTTVAPLPNVPAPATTTLVNTIPTPVPPAGPFGQFAEDRHWPEMPLQEAAAFDPFAPPAWAAPIAATGEGAAHDENQINELLAAENAIIFVAGDKRIARIGEHEYQIGDVIGRFKISDISSKGVVLSQHE